MYVLFKFLPVAREKKAHLWYVIRDTQESTRCQSSQERQGNFYWFSLFVLISDIKCLITGLVLCPTLESGLLKEFATFKAAHRTLSTSGALMTSLCEGI